MNFFDLDSKREASQTSKRNGRNNRCYNGR